MEVILSISLHPYIYYPPRAVIHTSVRSQLSVLVVVALAEFVQNTLFTSTTPYLHEGNAAGPPLPLNAPAEAAMRLPHPLQRSRAQRWHSGAPPRSGWHALVHSELDGTAIRPMVPTARTWRWLEVQGRCHGPTCWGWRLGPSATSDELGHISRRPARCARCHRRRPQVPARRVVHRVEMEEMNPHPHPHPNPNPNPNPNQAIIHRQPPAGGTRAVLCRRADATDRPREAHLRAR